MAEELPSGSHQLSGEEARTLTDEVRRDIAPPWEKMLRLHDGGAHRVLGYSAWGDYCEAELDQSRSYGYRVIKAGRVAAELEASRPGATRGLSEKQARALVRLEHDDRLRVADHVRERGGFARVTAADVRTIAEDVAPRPTLAPALQQAITNDVGPIEARAAVRAAARELASTAKIARAAKFSAADTVALLDDLGKAKQTIGHCEALLMYGDESAEEALRRLLHE